MSDEQIAHDLAIVIVKNRGIDTPIDALEEYQEMYKTLLHNINK